MAEPHGSHSISPWLRAESLQWPCLYWAPLPVIPVRSEERRWLAHVGAALAGYGGTLGLAPQPFLSQSVIHAYVNDAFLGSRLALGPMLVYGRRPWEPPPGRYGEDVLQEVKNPERPLPLDSLYRGLYQWCHCSDLGSFLGRFGGYGGCVVLFGKGSPGGLLPSWLPPGVLENPFLQAAIQDERLAAALSMSARMGLDWPAKLKQALLYGWESVPEVADVPTIIPTLRAADFFHLDQSFLGTIFELCPIYFRESPDDGGLLLAAGFPLEDLLEQAGREWKDKDGRALAED